LNTKINDTSLWDHYRGVIRSNIGGWVIGEAVYNHGYSMMDDFVGKLSYMQVVILNAVGRIPSREFADWIEASFICLSWPDSRIWCNQIGALGGSNRTSTIAATTAGVLANDAGRYGTKPVMDGVRFIQSAMKRYEAGESVEEIVDSECAKHHGKPFIMGYARPIAKGDARVPALERVQKELGLEVGKHQKLACRISERLEQKFNEQMNVNGYLSAVFSDHAYTPEEMYRVYAGLVSSGVTACYVDAMQKPAESFFSLRCEDVEYKGKSFRTLE